MSSPSKPSLKKPKKTQKPPLSFLRRFLLKIVRPLPFSSLPLKPILLGLLLLLTVAFILFVKDLPNPKNLSGDDYPESSLIFAKDGELLYEFFADRKRVPVKKQDLPDHLIQATLAIEDANFYHHLGFDFRGIVRATWRTLTGKRLEGGSTLTQQLVKNALLTQERTVKRKVKEAFLTLFTEILYTKDEILEMYLNQTPYGGTAWGIEAAAQTYFKKPAQDLSLAESALLAGLPAAPTAYSPFSHPDRAKSRQTTVLSRMVETKSISREEADQALSVDLNLAAPTTQIKAPHFVFFVRDYLVDRYGEAVVDTGGLRVTTTLNLPWQEDLETIIASETARLARARVGNGAILVTEPKTGKIRAMIGSKDYFAEDVDGKFNVTTASRQPGSSIKPLNYAIGLDQGKFTAATVFNDMPTCFVQAGQKNYCPSNYDNLFHGPVSLRYALGNSFNLPAVKALYLNGLENFVASASAMGISTFQDPKNYGLSLTLGGGEVRMIDMATAFAVLANGGVRQDLTSIEKVLDRQGQTLEEYQYIPGRRVLSMEASWIVHHILSDDSARSAVFGAGSDLYVKGHPEIAAKTGTTNDRKDNWTIGFSPSQVTVVWIGNNDNSPMSAIASGSVGASSIFAKTVKATLNEEEKSQAPLRPVQVVGRNVCNQTGTLPPPEGCETRYEYFIDRFGPPAPVSLRQTILVDKDTGYPVQRGEEKTNVEFQDHVVVTDLLGTILCLDCSPLAPPSPVIVR